MVGYRGTGLGMWGLVEILRGIVYGGFYVQKV